MVDTLVISALGIWRALNQEYKAILRDIVNSR